MAKNINIVIDSSIFKQCCNLNNASFRALISYCNIGYIKLHIPSIIQNEFITYCEDEGIKNITSSIGKLKNVEKYSLNESELSNSSAIIEKLNELKGKLSLSIKGKWDDFLSETNAKIYPIQDHHGKKVMEAYFNGDQPYKSRKNRNDIPDSFIYESIIDIIDKEKELNFVCADKLLCSCIEQVPNIKVYFSLDEIFESSDIKKILDDIDQEYHTKIFLSKLNRFDSYIKSELYEKLNDMLHLQSFTDEHIPDDNNEGIIDGINSLEEISLEYEESYFYSKSIFLIPFTLKADIYVSYFMYKYDYYAMDIDWQTSVSKEDWNDHYFQIEEEFNTFIDGIISIKIDDAINYDNIKENDITINIDKIKQIRIEDENYIE